MQIYTTPEVAEILGCNDQKIRDFIRDGSLVAFNLTRDPNDRVRWRVSHAELERFIESRRAVPATKSRRRRRRKPLSEEAIK